MANCKFRERQSVSMVLTSNSLGGSDHTTFASFEKVELPSWQSDECEHPKILRLLLPMG